MNDAVPPVQPWKRISRTTVYANRWMQVFEDQVETSSGHALTYGIVAKDPCVLIIPWDGNVFTLVGQYRYPTNEFSWEFPQGHGEHGSVSASALTELREETGLHAQTLTEIGRLNIAAGFCTQVCHVFVATDITAGQVEREQSEEDMRIRRVGADELRQMIARAEIRDSHTIAAYSLFALGSSSS